MSTLDELFGALAGIPRFDGARCVGKWELFDSLEADDVQEAISVCDGCPALEKCRDWADSQPKYRFEGVVAGKPRRPRKPKPKPKSKPAAVPA